MSNEVPIGFYDPRTDYPAFEPMDHFNNYKDMCALLAIANKVTVNGTVPLRFCEVGTWAGQVPLLIKDRYPDAEITVVDTWEGTTGDRLEKKIRPIDAYFTFVRNMGIVKENWMPRVIWDTSVKAANEERKRGRLYDMVFIDANHEYKDVVTDIKEWLPLVRPEGFLCGHDYGYFGVTDAVEELLPYRKVCGNVWWVRNDSLLHPM